MAESSALSNFLRSLNQGMKSDPISIISIVLANLSILLGVLFFGWTVSDMIVLFWAESAIIGLFTIIKMALAQGMASDPTGQHVQKAALIPFFTAHFGLFMFVHLIFLMGVIIPMVGSFESAKLSSILLNIATGFAILLLSHTLSFATNYMGKKEYLKATPDALMFAPYGRVIAMHIFIMASAFIFSFLQGSLPPLLFSAYVTLVIVGKIVFDVRGHINEHLGVSLTG